MEFTINGVPGCRTCWGAGKMQIPGFMDPIQCEDCLGTGIDSDIPLAIALDDVPEHVEAFSTAPLAEDPLEDALSLQRKVTQKILPGIIADAEKIASIYRRAPLHGPMNRRVA